MTDSTQSSGLAQSNSPPTMTPAPPEADTVARPGILLPLGIIYVLTIAAQLISLAYGRLDASQTFSSMLLPSVAYLSVLTIPAAWIGIVLGRRTGLGTPGIDALLMGQPGAARKLPGDIMLAVVLGLLLGGLILALSPVIRPILPPESPELGFRGVTGGLAVSLGAAVGEEVWFRFGLMTLLVWIAARLRGTDRPSNAAVWTIIVIAGVAFAAAHLPQLVAHGAGAPAAVTVTLLGNVAVSVLYGWLYWRRSLIAAVVAHFSVDLVLHVLTALMS